MLKQYKIDKVQELVQKLNEKNNLIFTNYSGIKVSTLNELRSKLRENGADYKIIKNRLFKRALKDAGYVEVDEYLKGPIGVVFSADDLGEIAKILKDFKKEEEKFSFSLGIMSNVVYNEEQINKIADIPSKEVLIAQIMSLLNAPASGIAMIANQVTASLARGIQAVAEENSQ
jgi:large subunit ribosomal protein L10